MTTTNLPTAHKELVTKHTTMTWVSDVATLTVRKDAGEYIVKLYDHESGDVTTKAFKTLPGALVCADNLREYYL